MELQKIKSFCEKREGGVKRLAYDIGMSEANLHRCIRNNQIQAGDLEKIASELGVDVSVFFDSIPSTVSTGELPMETINDRIECVVNEFYDGKKATFAKAIGLDRFAIANYLGPKKRSKPPVDMLAKIVRALNVDAYWLLTGEGEMMKDEAAERRIVVRDTMSENSREIELLRAQLEEKERTILILQQFIEELKKR